MKTALVFVLLDNAALRYRPSARPDEAWLLIRHIRAQLVRLMRELIGSGIDPAQTTVIALFQRQRMHELVAHHLTKFNVLCERIKSGATVTQHIQKTRFFPKGYKEVANVVVFMYANEEQVLMVPTLQKHEKEVC